MKNSTFLRQLFPIAYQRFAATPIFGGVTNAFAQWLDKRGYSHHSLRFHLSSLGLLSRWLLRRGRMSLAAIDQQILAAAHQSFLRRSPHVGGTVGAMELFLRERGTIRKGRPAPPSASEIELAGLAAYLREFRQLSEGTILAHQGRLRPFLKFIRMDQRPQVMRTLSLTQIQGFIKQAARTNNRFSMQHVVGALRAFLKAKHAQGVIAQPLHEQIDTPRVYRLERLPRAFDFSFVSWRVWARRRPSHRGVD